jgi:hypothetical protein
MKPKIAVWILAKLDGVYDLAGGALEVGDQVIVAERSTAGRALPRPRLSFPMLAIYVCSGMPA